MFQPQIEAAGVSDRQRIQGQRLVALLRRLDDVDSAYWRSKLEGVDIDAVQGIGDLGILPFTVKAELRDSYPFGMLAAPLRDCVRIHASSGTSGKPTVVAYSAADVSLFAEVNARSIACAGGVAEDVLHVAYGYGLFTGGLGLHYGGERLGATVVPASGGNPGLQVSLMADLGANGLCATPSFALLLAEQAEADGLMGQIRSMLRYGVFGAEPWSEGMRSKLEEAWGGIDACDIYGLSEVIGPGVAAECREGKGAMHVFDDHFVPEIVDPDTGEPAADGAPGELVLTTLTKQALPVLRYRTGDVTRFVDDRCPCGRTHRRIARLAGRTDDMLVIRGVNVFPSAIEAVLLEDPDVGAQYQIWVDRRGTMAELTVKAELASGGLPAGSRADVEARLRRRLAERMRVRVEVQCGEPGSLPRPEAGKVQRVFDVQ
jgi:phenylacetate-CoA ligase